MTSHPSKGATNLPKGPDHSVTAAASGTECKNTLRLLPALTNSSLTSLLYLSVGYMLAEKGMIAAGLLALSCLLLKVGIYLADLITETLREK